MTKHKHHHSHAARVDLERQRVRLDGETYRQDELDGSYWYRVSKTRCRKDRQDVPFVPAEKRNHKRHDWDDVLRPLDDNKRKDRHLIRTLERAVERAERQKERQEKGTIPKVRDVIAMEHAIHGTPEPDSDVGEESERKSASYPRPKQSSTVKRTKRGVRVFSGDKYYFDIAVFKSRKYPGCASVRLVVAGKWYNYTLDAANMKALREEVARGGN
jgi:hypothetical protein